MKVIVHTPFKLTRDDGTTVAFAVGEHDLPEAEAVHWYTKLFSKLSGAVEKVEADIKGKSGK